MRYFNASELQNKNYGKKLTSRAKFRRQTNCVWTNDGNVDANWKLQKWHFTKRSRVIKCVKRKHDSFDFS